MTQTSDPSLIERLTAQAIATAPSVALGLATLIGGWIASLVARRVATRMADRLGLEVLAEKIGMVRLFYAVGIRQGLARTVGQLVYYIGIGLTLYVALMNLGLAGVNRALNQAMNFAPNVVAAIGLVIAAALGGQTLKSLIQREDASGNRALLGQLVSAATLALGATLALEQLGFEVALIHGLVLAAYTAGALAIAIGFALGARSTFSQLISRHWAQKLLRPGDRVVLGDIDGVVSTFGPMNLILSCEDGREVLLPYHQLLGSAFELPEHKESPAS